jgi:hypothetical protein
VSVVLLCPVITPPIFSGAGFIVWTESQVLEYIFNRMVFD